MNLIEREMDAHVESRPFDRCYQQGCKKAPTQVVKISFPDKENGPYALSYCKKHGDFLAEYVPTIAVVRVLVEKLPLT